METLTDTPKHRAEPLGLLSDAASDQYERNRVGCAHQHRGEPCPQWGADFYTAHAKHRSAA